MKERYLKKLFQAYYRANARNFVPVSDLPSREFAFLYWLKRGMIRHIYYPKYENLLDQLIRSPPRHAYHSATYYQKPGAPTMDKKGYLGCDLVFDIDSDHIPTPCSHEHNYAICKQCNLVIKGDKPSQCPECESTKFNKVVWICDECLNVSKNQVFHLVDNFLLHEFALDLDDINIYFSGHRGYHAHIKKDTFRKLDQDARREIADYLTGTGFSYKLWGYQNIQQIWQGFSIDQEGWSGKIAKEFYNILHFDQNKIKSIFQKPRYGKPMSSAIVNRLFDEKTYLIRQMEQRDRIWGIKGIGDSSWIRIFEILRDRIKADIDVVVSIDLHRLIRLNGTLHGKTGFRVRPVEYDQLKEFDPLEDALSFPIDNTNRLEIIITAPQAPVLRIGDTTYGPYVKGEHVTLPLNPAIFLLCKDVANLIKN